MSLGHSVWLDHFLADVHRFDADELLELVSFITLVALIALAGVSVAAVTLLYAL